MHANDEKMQRELHLTRRQMERAAHVSGRGIVTALALGSFALSGFFAWQWSVERARNHDLHMQVLELLNTPNDPGPPVTANAVESLLLQWTEWRYSKVRATIRADYGRVQRLLSRALANDFASSGPNQFDAGRVAVEHETGTAPDVIAKADAIELVEHIGSDKTDAYRYQVLVSLHRADQSAPEYRRVNLTVVILTPKAFSLRFRQWEQAHAGDGQEYKKLNGARLEIIAYTDTEDYARAAVH